MLQQIGSDRVPEFRHRWKWAGGGLPLALLCGLLLHGAAQAQRTLYTCVDSLGRKTLQDSPCAGGQSMEKSYRTMTPDAPAADGVATPGAPRSASARRVRDNTYLCAALREEREDAGGRLEADAAAERAGYWREQLRRIDSALCAQGCRKC